MYYLKSLDLREKKVLLRLDLDLPENQDGFDQTRLDYGLPTLQTILKKHIDSVHIIGHRGRPNGKKSKKYSLKPIEKLILDRVDSKFHDKISFGENLRFDPGEEKNTKTFAKQLAKGFDVYVNDAFATAHREHASVVQLPYLLPTVMGRQFEKEIKVLRQIVYAPKRPLTLILGGAKPEKLEYIDKLFDHFNVFLVGGKLAEDNKHLEETNRKLIVANLTEDGLDMDVDSTEQFDRFIKASETVVWNGPLGKYEDGEHHLATEFIANSMARSKVYSYVCGGDTEAALDHLGFEHKNFNHVSTGGGAVMEYLANGTLPGQKAIEESQKQFEWDELLEFVA
jgi:phosphoglycerate kinase